MSLTVPFLPPRLGSDDVREDNVFIYVVVVACFLGLPGRGILTIQQLSNSMKLVIKIVSKWLLFLTHAHRN